MTTHAAVLAKLESLIAQWEDEATEADGDYYAEQYDSHRKCASELREALAGATESEEGEG